MADRFGQRENVSLAVKEVKSLVGELQSLQFHETRSFEAKIRHLALKIFGPRSKEYKRVKGLVIFRFEESPAKQTIDGDDEQTRWLLEDYHRRMSDQFCEGVEKTTQLLEKLLAALIDRQRRALASVNECMSVFRNLNLHSAIAAASTETYENGHYRESVLNASIALVNYVKEKSRRRDLDGSGLMSTVFSAKRPILAFNDLSNQTERDEQEGFMHLFMGAALALRNPRAHAISDDSPEMALDYIAFLSMLAKRLDGAKRT